MRKRDKAELGKTSFDFSDYVDKSGQNYKLNLEGGPDPDAFIEIFIKAKLLEKRSPSQRSQRSATSKRSRAPTVATEIVMGTIAERDSENSEIKAEDIEMKDKQYQ